MINIKATFFLLLLAGSLSASVAYLVSLGIETGDCRLVSYGAGSQSNRASDTASRMRVEERAGQR